MLSNLMGVVRNEIPDQSANKHVKDMVQCENIAFPWTRESGERRDFPYTRLTKTLILTSKVPIRKRAISVLLNSFYKIEWYLFAFSTIYQICNGFSRWQMSTRSSCMVNAMHQQYAGFSSWRYIIKRVDYADQSSQQIDVTLPIPNNEQNTPPPQKKKKKKKPDKSSYFINKSFHQKSYEWLVAVLLWY